MKRKLVFCSEAQPNLRVANRVRTVGSTNYQWDANGNMVNDGGAVLTWDEENRLTGHSKSLKKTCFFYDAAGERYYKNSGLTMMIVNNGVWQMMTFYENPTLYASPYVVATPDGYTKHYFVESERFASRIGDGTITGLNTHAATASVLAAKQAKVNDAAPDSIRPDNFTFLRSMPNHLSAHHTTYWQHSDHLGSASWVTDTNGLGYQHFQYRAWGEPFIEQNSTANGYETRYTFSGKERDEETGYSYFGARYYNSVLSIWLSVDPMSDKYPSTSPYTYCANNPVRLVDPNGEAWLENENTGDVKYVRHYRIKDASKLGDGWKWMGGNGMFGKNDNEVIRSNLTEGQACFVDNYNDIISTSYSGTKAESFMNKMGYEKRPLLQDVKSREITQIMPDAMGPASFAFTEKTETIERTHSYTYAPKGAVALYEIKEYYKKSMYEQQPLLNRRTTTYFERRQYSYVRPTLGNTIRPIIGPLIQTLEKLF